MWLHGQEDVNLHTNRWISSNVEHISCYFPENCLEFLREHGWKGVRIYRVSLYVIGVTLLYVSIFVTWLCEHRNGQCFVRTCIVKFSSQPIQ